MVNLKLIEPPPSGISIGFHGINLFSTYEGGLGIFLLISKLKNFDRFIKGDLQRFFLAKIINPGSPWEGEKISLLIRGVF